MPGTALGGKPARRGQTASAGGKRTPEPIDKQAEKLLAFIAK